MDWFGFLWFLSGKIEDTVEVIERKLGFLDEVLGVKDVLHASKVLFFEQVFHSVVEKAK